MGDSIGDGLGLTGFWVFALTPIAVMYAAVRAVRPRTVEIERRKKAAGQADAQDCA